eukprot:366410-Chlamydomonas_euryale.AAC.2
MPEAGGRGAFTCMHVLGLRPASASAGVVCLDLRPQHMFWARTTPPRFHVKVNARNKTDPSCIYCMRACIHVRNWLARMCARNDEQRLVSEANASVKPKASPSDFPLPGKDPIYVGFGKDELEVKRTGVKGRIIYDQSAKYPSKEDAGFFTGVAGGFAGGERGIQAFIRDGEVSIRRPDEPPSQSISPLEATFLLLLATGSAAVVGLQYYDPETGFQADRLEEAIESAAAYKIFGVSALYGGLTLTGVLVSLAALRAVLSSLSSQFKDNAKKAVVYAVFGYVLFNIARGVLEF